MRHFNDQWCQSVRVDSGEASENHNSEFEIFSTILTIVGHLRKNYNKDDKFRCIFNSLMFCSYRKLNSLN